MPVDFHIFTAPHGDLRVNTVGRSHSSRNATEMTLVILYEVRQQPSPTHSINVAASAFRRFLRERRGSPVWKLGQCY